MLNQRGLSLSLSPDVNLFFFLASMVPLIFPVGVPGAQSRFLGPSPQSLHNRILRLRWFPLIFQSGFQIFSFNILISSALVGQNIFFFAAIQQMIRSAKTTFGNVVNHCLRCHGL